MWKLEFLGVIIQLVLLCSIYDVYKEYLFTSEVNLQNDPLADRIVIFVLSGLRPDMVCTAVSEINTIPLWHKFNVKGILKSEAPTTSKNGFVAFSSGVNEGMLTIVPIFRTIDTIFERVNGTLYFGPDNYDIIYFQKNLWTQMDFDIDLNTQNYTVNDKTLTNIQLSIDKIQNNKIILIHLKQLIEYSKTYDCLYKCVDIVVNLFNQINNVEKFMRHKFNNTVYLLMADHGMTSSGDFGGNSNEEVETFFALWGENISCSDNASMKQIQIANLISTFLGVELPRNSLALTPVELLNVTNEKRQQYKALNAMHLSSIALKSADQLGLFIKLLNYIELELFTGYNKMVEYDQLLTKKMKLDEFNDTEAISDELISLSLNGIERMKTIMDFMMVYLINSICMGWILLLIFVIMNSYYNQEKNMSNEEIQEEDNVRRHHGSVCITMNSSIILMGILAFIFVVAHSWPLQYFAYWLLPLVIAHRVICATPKWKCIKALINLKTLPRLSINIVVLSSVSELLVWGIEYRILLFLAVIMVTIYLTVRCLYNNSAMIMLSVVTSGLSLALSIILPHDIQKISPLLLNLSALVWIAAGTIASFKMRFTFIDYLVTVAALVHHICSLILLNIIFIKPDAKEYNVIWVQLATAIFIPLFGGTLTTNRIKQIAICLSSIFLLFSQNHESLAFFILFIMLICWFYVEDEQEQTQLKTSLDLPIIFVTLVLSSYYLMGNADDFNFINVKFTHRFIEDEQPLIEYLLLLIKHCIVLYLLQTMFSVILRRRNENKSLFLVTILLLNCIGYRYLLQLLFWPHQDETSRDLTKHCLIQINSAFLLGTFSLAELITSCSIGNRCEYLRDAMIAYFKKKERSLFWK